ncbi:MAG TPA: cbb3-type cytochrome c oxidase N-terminal domain-containing protein [Puia sp.]|nr:cbb3-type cytochrome c oxidase N-terminal domain-containing protein [Puia sp.]
MTSSTDNPFVVIMLVVIFILGIAISLLANVLLSAAQYKAQESNAGKPGSADRPPAATDGSPVAAVPSLPGAASSGESTPRTPTTLAGVGAALSVTAVNGISDTAFYLIVSVIALEVFIIMALLYNLRVTLGLSWRRRTGAVLQPVPKTPGVSWWARLNRFKPAEQEADLDLGHDYDGIRELDNRLPPWWLYGFYCTIVFACIYLWRYHVAHTAPLPAEEYRIAVQEAAIRKAEYLKKAADNVDENTVKLLTSPDDLAAGRVVFEGTCFACHGKHGEGGVGPNLTDDYWLHGGNINDVFRTIKYGWPDKGMKSWKDDYSPRQIAQIASYVKSLGGTHPDNPKPPQGTLYKP